jgi:hypothetical protein
LGRWWIDERASGCGRRYSCRAQAPLCAIRSYQGRPMLDIGGREWSPVRSGCSRCVHVAHTIVLGLGGITSSDRTCALDRRGLTDRYGRRQYLQQIRRYRGAVFVAASRSADGAIGRRTCFDHKRTSVTRPTRSGMQNRGRTSVL